MKDEIKEILNNIKNKYEDYYVQDIVSGNDLKQLLDYITNLQTIEREYSAILSENAELQQKYDMSLEDNVKESKKRMELQEENERLKIKCDFLAGKKMLELDKNAKQLEIKAIEQIDYKTRNEKAIEYIKSNLDNTGWLEIGSQDVEVLINILQGKSDE